jgi:carboxymethylenebutenolidase
MINQEIISLYDEYTHKTLDRRAFLSRLAGMVGGMTAATALVSSLEASAAAPQQISPSDARLETETIRFQGTNGEIRGYAARPKNAGALPVVIVIHENRGLNKHIEDVARRMALEGFFVVAPDMLSPLGGTPEDADAARGMIAKLIPGETIQNLRAVLAFLAKDSRGNGRVGAVGFCWGGGVVGDFAASEPNLSAGVVYYGRQPKSEEVPNIATPLLLHYAGLDERVNAGIPAFEEALKKYGKQYELFRYEGAQHAFNNDTSEARYNKEAAETAWKRTVEFFRARLGANK